KIKRSVHIKIKTEGAETDYEQLLVKWLNELLYLNETEDLLFKSFRVESIVDGELKALACGERFSPERHVILTPFKAVTYHRIEIAREPDRWHARVIVDI
ncbi:MAG: archease, partial [Candidatus Brocadiales bacterium]